MDDFTIDIDTKALDEMLAALPTKVQGKVMRDALQAAAEVILAPMKALAPERTDEETPDSTSLPPGIMKHDLTTQVQMGTQYPPRVKIGPTEIAGHVARWQNNGWTLTGHGASRKGRKQIKAIPGKHFMEGAFDEAGEAALETFIEKLGEGIVANSGPEISEES